MGVVVVMVVEGRLFAKPYKGLLCSRAGGCEKKKR
jgi:hypothetical protein